MKPHSEILPWEALSKKAYWDRDVPLSTWREKTREAHRSFLPGALKAFDPVEFIHYYGLDAFKADWPRLRKSLEADVVRRNAPVFDLAWSRLTSGSWNLPPDERIPLMPTRRRDFLFAVAREPGLSIYAIASRLSMQYRRGHEHAKALSDAGLLRLKPSVKSGRLSNLLFPRHPDTSPLRGDAEKQQAPQRSSATEPGLEHLARLCQVLDCTADWLILGRAPEGLTPEAVEQGRFYAGLSPAGKKRWKILRSVITDAPSDSTGDT